MEQTFVMIKPDGVQRSLVGEILARFEKKGFKIVGLKLMKVTEELAGLHYQEHKGKPFYPGLIKYITSAPVVVMVVEGKNAVSEVRKINGATNPLDAQPGTIRGDFAQDIGRNVIHGSDSVESAKREISIYFKQDELLEYNYAPATWLFE
ncbi:MAG: nucleoside-diphosphate kinase [Clostridia bacterium]|jgi:nucleoside-diphosphate kinase|nr:nucleoside-diphosphate kinase [Clostridia bacterium]MDN5321667.1 nucleoside-diphosphate kinase [Clostridia bacterium]